MMISPSTLMRTDLPLTGRRQGKVRDIYEARMRDGRDALLIVATDRLSAFDVVMTDAVPDKGVVLTQLSRFWFDRIAQQLSEPGRPRPREDSEAGRPGPEVPLPGLSHHLLSTDPADVEGLTDEQIRKLRGRVMIGRRCRVVPIECVVRGYLAGSGWKEYQQSRTVCGLALPDGLDQCAKLPEPIFTPASKASTGHDENISFERACELVGEATMTQLRDHSLALYTMAHDYARERGIILADTKFEFGVPLDADNDGPILIDEALTPDSSRFWPADQYEPGRDQPSFDKQYVRNYLQSLVDQRRWNKQPPPPPLPDEIVNNTRAKYLEAFERLTGKPLELD